ncbi:SatD family protein [Sedimentibacter sp.]|uniref:SatD family protein n=1 Tax=Sedimentibacter sp. TaxID=1960295 RepID=UPI0028A84797|nr:SatD family protein [Sedimentibacter sp.]
MKNYTALIIDLKSSRSYSVEDRNSIQNYIITVIQNLNEVFSGSLSRDVEFSAGDEVQGLFVSPESAYLYFRMFSMLISPVEIRAGIGVGEWNVKVENASTTAQDGPVYHNARYAIDNLKDAIGYSVLLYSGSKVDLFLNAVINTSFALTNNHSEYQNELMLLSELLYPIDYRQVIGHNKISLISKLITSKNKLNYYTYYKKSKSVKKYPFDKIEYISFESFPIDAAANDDSTFYVSGGKKRGMITQLSEILNISRQSIEKTFKVANIYEARNSTIVALKFMDEYL